MAFPTKDGKKSYTNKSQAKHYDRRMAAESDKNAEMPQEAEPEQDEASQVAEQHGPAHEIHIMHQHEMGMHHVQSMHPDGYEHHSDHMSAEEAHEHASKLAGKEHSPEAIEGLKKFAEEEGEEAY